jgi:predicted lipid-binding transport protein (Tim44 family)
MKTELFRKYIDMINESQDPIVTFASDAHEQWRQALPPNERNQPRKRSKNGGPVADINVPFNELHPTAQQENLAAAKAAYDAVSQYDNEEQAAEHIHNEWMKRNPKVDYNAAQHVPYSQLPDVEKKKDRVHVQTMKALLGKR